MIVRMATSKSRSLIDVTTLDTIGKYREYIRGLKDGGMVKLEMVFTRETFEIFETDFGSDTAGDYEIILPDDTTQSFYFQGFVKDLEIMIQADDYIGAQVGIKVTGPVVNTVTGTRTATSPILLTIAYTGTEFAFKFKLPSSKSVKLNWGDGTSETVVGQDSTLITKTSAYAGVGTYYFSVTGDALDLTYIDISAQVFVSGDVSSWSALTNLTYLRCNSTSVSGDVSSWSALTNLTHLRCYSTSVSGDVSSWSALTNLTLLYCSFTSVSGDVSGWSALTNLTLLYCHSTSVSGDVSGWSALTNLTYLYCNSTSVSGDVSSWSALTNLTHLYCSSTSVSGDVSSWSALTNLTYLYCSSTSVEFNGTTAWTMTGAISLYSNGWTSTMVDNSLAAFAATPLTGCTIDVSGTNAARTAASDADKAIIINPANSNTLTVNE